MRRPAKPIHEPADDLAINRISKKSNFVLNIVFLVWALACVLPLLLVVIVSFSSEQSIFQNGYSFIPSEWSLAAYEFFFKLGDQLVRSYGITIFVTVFGTLFSLAITAMFAYVLSRSDYAYNRIFTLLMLFTMLFNGGLIPSYVTIKNYGLMDSLWALVLPTAVPVFNVILLMNFFRNIPKEMDEVSRLDGCGPWRLLFSVYLPLAMPAIATVTLFSVVSHWNAFFDGLIYMNRTENYPLATYIQTLVVQPALAGLSASERIELARVSSKTLNAAKIFVSLVPILAIYPFFQRYLVHGIMLGSVKE